MILDPPAHDELQAEHGPRDRRAEDGTEAPGHTRGQELPPHWPLDSEAVREPVGEARPHLHGRAFAAGAPAEEVREHGAHEHQGSHPQRDLRAVVVDRVDNEVVASLDRLPESRDDPAEHEARHRQYVHDQLVARAKRRRPVEQPEEPGRGRAAEHPDERAEHEPLAEGPTGTEQRLR